MRAVTLRRPVNTVGYGSSFDRFFEDFMNQGIPHEGLLNTWTPPVDVRETEEAYILEAELPGLSRDDFEIKVEQDVLNISSKAKEEKEEKKEGYLIRERRSSSFRRSFRLPRDVDKSSLKASFDKGVLNLYMGKLPEAKPLSITID